MDPWIKEYVRTCDICQWNKSPRHAKYGLLQPLDTSFAPLISVLVDFMVALPESQGFTQIMVVVDQFMKVAHFVGLPEDATSKYCSSVFLKEVWKLHGLPDTIISDRHQMDFWILEGTVQFPKHQKESIYSISFLNQWTDRTSQPNSWTIPENIH